MRYYLNREECIACGLCQTYAPHIIDYDDDGIVMFKHEMTFYDDKRNDMKEACLSCPVHAICPERH